jgi:hypothetical protein
VETSAVINGRERWLSVGEAVIIDTSAGRKLCLEMASRRMSAKKKLCELQAKVSQAQVVHLWPS